MPPTTEPATTEPPTTEPPTTTTTEAPTTTSSTTTHDTTGRGAPTTTSSTTTTTVPPTTTSTSTTTTSTTVPPVTAPVSTLPDGRPVVAEIRLAADQTTLTGAVPTAEDKTRLEAFAADYALADAPVVDELTVDPNVPADAGVRWVELDAANFVDDSSDLSPEQTQQLGRVVTAMNDNPTLAVHVVGNTDLGGNPTLSFAVSQRRAHAVINYLVAQGGSVRAG